MTRYLPRRLGGLVASLGLGGGLLFAAGAASYVAFEAHRQHRLRVAEQLARRRAAWTGLERQVDAAIRQFSAQGGQAGIVIKDLRSGWQLARQADRALPAASVVKIAVMAACFEAAE